MIPKQKVPNLISFKKENYKTHINDFNIKNNCNIDKWVEDGELIKIEEWHFIDKENYNIIESELLDYYKIVDLTLINQNPELIEDIQSFIERKKVIIEKMTNDYFSHLHNGVVFEMPIFSLCRRIVEQPIYVINAVNEYDCQELTRAQKTYYIHNRINASISFAKDKFEQFNIDLEKLVNYQLARRYDKTSILNLFLFTEQFINELKFYRTNGINYFESPLFKIFLTSILNYKSRYIQYHGEFDFKNIAELIEQMQNRESELKTLPPQPIETNPDKLKVPQIALIHVYEGIQVTRENAPEIALKHGYKAKNSGEGLFQDYTFYCSIANRKGKPTPCTPKRLKNKIELFESVVNYLSDSNKQRAIDEIKILKTLFENEYQ